MSAAYNRAVEAASRSYSTPEGVADAVLAAGFDVEEIAQAIGKASWPDGGHDGFPSRKVAEILAAAIRASILGVER